MAERDPRGYARRNAAVLAALFAAILGYGALGGNLAAAAAGAAGLAWVGWARFGPGGA